MEKQDGVIDWLKREMTRHQRIIDHAQKCPHCGAALNVASMSWKEMAMVCNAGHACPYYAENGSRFRIDVGHSTQRVEKIRKELAIVQSIGLLRRLRDTEPSVWDRFATPEDLDLWDNLREEYESIEKVYNIVAEG